MVCCILTGYCYDGRRVESKGWADQETREIDSRVVEGIERSSGKTQHWIRESVTEPVSIRHLGCQTGINNIYFYSSAWPALFYLFSSFFFLFKSGLEPNIILSLAFEYVRLIKTPSDNSHASKIDWKWPMSLGDQYVIISGNTATALSNLICNITLKQKLLLSDSQKQRKIFDRSHS